jgi:hypothetical protein
VTQDIIQADRSIFRRYRDMGDGTYAEIVVSANIEADRELLVTRYACKAAFTGATVGDVIRRTDVLELGAVTTVVSVTWFNETAGQDISAPPSITANLSTVSTGGSLTQTQLMASGLATATNQVTAIGYLADLADNPHNPHAAYKLTNSEDLGTGTKYIAKAVGSAWLVIRKTYTDTAATFAYATPTNNPSVTTPAAAWAARATMTYGAPQA